MKTALITGSLGQDGTYLTEHLLSLGYKVFCGIRRAPSSNCSLEKVSWSEALLQSGMVEFLYVDVRDDLSIRTAIRKSWPDELYNLAGQVYVPLSWEMPEATLDINTGGLARILRIVEEVKKDTRVYQASSSEMYGNHEGTCTEQTLMNPTSPYGVSKYAAHRLVSLYRSRGVYAVAGILFNHESPRRGHEMVTRKIARVMAGWTNGSDEKLVLGNLDSRRDWGFAGEYVKAMHMMLQAQTADDYVVGTGVSHSVADFVEFVRQELDIPNSWVGQRLTIDPRFKRTQEIFDMRADNSKMIEAFGWSPQVDLRQLVRLMVQAEVSKLESKLESKEVA